MLTNVNVCFFSHAFLQSISHWLLIYVILMDQFKIFIFLYNTFYIVNSTATPQLGDNSMQRNVNCKTNPIMTSMWGSTCPTWVTLLFAHMRRTLTGRQPLAQCKHVCRCVLAIHLPNCRYHMKHVRCFANVSVMATECYKLAFM